MLVQDLYDKLATITGFPLYVNETDTPDITRFLLDNLSQALLSVIDNLYLSNNVLERTSTIVTNPNQDLYGIEGVIKNLQLVDGNKKVKQIPYNDRFNNQEILPTEDGKNMGEPSSYVIKGGYLRLLPIPDKNYTLRMTVSTTDLIMSNDDSLRNTIESIDDTILANNDFCNLVVIKAAVLIFTRCQNNNALLYNSLYEDRLKTFVEHDSGTMEAQRGWIKRAGNYDPRRGLLG